MGDKGGKKDKHKSGKQKKNKDAQKEKKKQDKLPKKTPWARLLKTNIEASGKAYLEFISPIDNIFNRIYEIIAKYEGITF